MVNLKFGAFTFAFCLLLTSCVCESNETKCTIQDTIATCKSIEDFKSLQDTNITKLIVRSAELKRIHKDDLALFVHLEEIDLSNSGLEEIDEDAFVGLSKLHKINLAGNGKLKIPNDKSFIESDTLTCLNLSNTVVEELGDMLAHLPQLQDLDLSGTNIKDFSPLEHLEHLAKLVVSKTNATQDLCDLLPNKEIIEKDADTESPLDCKTKKEDIKTEAKDEAKVETTVKPEEESTTIANKTEEPTTIAPKIEAPKIEEPKVAIETNEPKENKTEAEPKLLHESSEKEATTIIAVVPIENTDVTTEAVKKNDTEVVEAVIVPHTEKPDAKETEQPIIKNEESTDKNKTANLFAAPKVKEGIDEAPKIVLQEADDVILPSTANTSQSNGVNIVLGIILCVMIVGAIGFGFKYWKNRRSGYTHANTHDHDDEDKELQTIVAHRTEPEQN